MPPAKRKADQPEGAPAPMRTTRAAAKSSAAPPAPEAKKAKKVKGAKKKTNEKEKEGGAVQTQKKIEEEKGKDASENVLDASNYTIVVEHCKQCNQFKKRANLVKEGLEKANCGVSVILNPEKPRRGCFEIRLQGGKKFISLLDMKRPFKPMKDLDMDEVISNIIDEISKTN